MANYVLNFSDLDLNKSYTYADYLLWKFSERVELIKGKIFSMSPAPNTTHLRLSQSLNRLLDSFFYKNKCQLFYAPFDVVLSKTKDSKKIKTVVQPDLGVICDLTKIDEYKCNGAPDLIIEILSPGNSKKEMKIKYELYEENGVLEYWIVDPEHETISIFSLHKNKYLPMKPLTTDDELQSVLFPKLKFPVETVFQDIHKFKKIKK